MGSEVETAWESQRIGIGVLADRLQVFAESGFSVTVVDHQSSTAAVSDAPAEFNCRGVGAPFEDRARARRLQSRRQQRLKKRQRFRCDGKGELIGGIDLDPAFVPAALGFNRLVDRERVEKFVGKDDGRTFRYLGQCGMPENGNAHILRASFPVVLAAVD